MLFIKIQHGMEVNLYLTSIVFKERFYSNICRSHFDLYLTSIVFKAVGETGKGSIEKYLYLTSIVFKDEV